MLLEYSCSNYKSIKDEITFSMLAGSDDTYEDKLIDAGNYRVLRSAIVYGANGSGKSNFINSLSFMKELVANSINHQPGEGIFQSPHKLAPMTEPSDFNIQFIKNGIRYAYGFSLLNNAVLEEYLYYFPNGRKVQIFERKENDIIPGSKYKGVFDVSLTILKENRLFLSCSANYTNVKEIEQAFLFFSEDIVVYNRVNNWIEYSIELMQGNEDIKAKFERLLQKFDTGIKGVDVKTEQVDISMEELPPEMPQVIKPLFVGKQKKLEARVNYELFSTDLMAEESDGIKKLFEMICPILDILSKGKVLICDEFEKSLHEILAYEIIKLFRDADQTAQIILSTHDTGLMNRNLFRRDQIWFTQLRDDRSTDLYSLTEIKNVRKLENLEKGYISGKYGAIPVLSQHFLNAKSETQTGGR